MPKITFRREAFLGKCAPDRRLGMETAVLKTDRCAEATIRFAFDGAEADVATDPRSRHEPMSSTRMGT